MTLLELLQVFAVLRFGKVVGRPARLLPCPEPGFLGNRQHGKA